MFATLRPLASKISMYTAVTPMLSVTAAEMFTVTETLAGFGRARAPVTPGRVTSRSRTVTRAQLTALGSPLPTSSLP